VLVDGRTVYTPTFGGVFWDTMDVPLGDIERIEVIRGPGGSVWGANAVNGVINIITKEASATQGAIVEASGGNVDRGFGTLQYGGQAGRSTEYRLYSKYLNQDYFAGTDGSPGNDGWHLLRAGFRVDNHFSSKDEITVEGDMYAGREGQGVPYLDSILSPGVQIVNGEVDLSGGFIQGTWKHTFSNRSDISLQSSFDRYQRDDALGEGRSTFNLDFQHHLTLGGRHDLVWGLGYSHSISEAPGSLFVSLTPSRFPTHLFSGFAQDEVALVPERLYLTLGAKLEHNYYTGLNAMPGASVAWLLTPQNTLWASVSRVARTPAAVDTRLRLNVGGFVGDGGVPTLISVFGNLNFKNEELLAYELGYRAALQRSLSLDLAAFYNGYDNLKTTEPATPFIETCPAPLHLVIPLTYENLMYGESQGIEAFANWNLSGRWTLSPGYAFEQIHMHLYPSSKDATSVPEAQGGSPVHSAQLRSHYVLPKGFDWDASAYFVDRIVDPAVPSYTRVDTSITWHWRERSSVTAVGQNLVSEHHLEYVDTLGSTSSTLVKRGLYAKFEYQF
jgi:iron complex outermembrane receptor protein